ncbi:hypothetical protein B296_00006017 [Ensete ventricosum]|uniref:Uncharacterized protein n=1 Tax=Ensete ventricosum TaxID=4639 RepID=A0A426YMC6_ENSVE|nr:hypothetical protein B296_00006017 [Ensete ventricosum]
MLTLMPMKAFLTVYWNGAVASITLTRYGESKHCSRLTSFIIRRRIRIFTILPPYRACRITTTLGDLAYSNSPATDPDLDSTD